MHTPKHRLPLLLALVAALVLAGCHDDDDLFDPINSARMGWTLTDACDDGLGLQAALFDTTNGLVYPSRDRVYTTSPGGDISVFIDCERGSQVCYGAETDPATDLFWGLGIDGNEGCDDCCDLCDDIDVGFTLSCNGPAGAKSATAQRTFRSKR